MKEDHMDINLNLIDSLFKNIRDSKIKLALVQNDNSISYDDLENEVLHFAQKLKSIGVVEKSHVIVNIEKTIEYPIILCALFRLGAVVIPIDVEYPLNRYINPLQAIDVDLLIYTRAEHSILKHQLNIKHTVSLLELHSLDSGDSELNSSQELESSGYIIFTSGTTGTPKGVFISQKNMIYYLNTLSQRLNLKYENKFLHIASISFSSSIRQLLLPMVYNSTLILLDEEKRKELTYIIDIITTEEITVLDITPSHLSAIIAAVLENKILMDQIQSHKLNFILTASEPLSTQLVRDTYKVFGKIAIVNMYGQTESAGIVSTEIISNVEDYKNFVYLGTPLICNEIKIFDEKNNVLNDGAVGEICVHGPTISRRFLCDEENLKDSFVYYKTKDKSVKYYKTGDYGKKLNNGKLEFCGRKEHFIKINASRVSLEEIKQNLLLHPDIQSAEVIFIDTQYNSKSIGAVIVPRVSKNLNIAKIKNFLQERLPHYMVPHHIKLVSAIPVNKNFKVNYQEIINLFQQITISSIESSDKVMEQIILDIWMKIFKSENITMEDDFYSLGGNSLIAARIAIQINNLFAAKLKLTDVLKHDTIPAIAKQIALQLHQEVT